MAMTSRLASRIVNRALCHTSSKHVANSSTDTKELNTGVTKDWKVELHNTMKILPNFISEKEEEIMIQEIEPYMKRLRYEFSHWDNVSKILFHTEYIHSDILLSHTSCTLALSSFLRQYMVTEKQSGGNGTKIIQRFLIRCVKQHFHRK